MESFSVINAFKDLTTTRCKPWDDRELDVLEGFRTFSFIFLTMIATSFYMIMSASVNTWKILDFFS